MKNTICVSILLGAAAAAMAFGSPADEEIHVTLPFALHVRGTVLPAGEYNFSLRSESSAVLTVVAKDGHTVLFVPTVSRNHYQGDHGALLIGDVNGQRYLEGVCFESDSTVFDIAFPKDLQKTSSR